MLQTVKQLHAIAVRNLAHPALSTLDHGGLRLELFHGVFGPTGAQ
jgi:hypothetical protein